MLHYVGRGGGVGVVGGGLIVHVLSVAAYLQARLSRGEGLRQLAPMMGKPECEDSVRQSHRVFECGDLLCGSARGLDFCVLVSLCWFSSCELPSSPLSFFLSFFFVFRTHFFPSLLCQIVLHLRVLASSCPPVVDLCPLIVSIGLI